MNFKSKKITIPIFFLVFVFLIAIMPLNLYTSVSESTRSSDLSVLNHFKDVGSIEVMNGDKISKKYKLSEGGNLIRLSIKDSVKDFPLTRWLPFIKFGTSNVRMYLKIENNNRNLGWNEWGSVVPLEIKIDLTIKGFCSASEYENIVIQKCLDFSGSNFNELINK